VSGIWQTSVVKAGWGNVLDTAFVGSRPTGRTNFKDNMLECLIIGDSIAVGTHQFKTDCVAYAKGGINSWQWNKMWPTQDLTSNIVIISLGSNDHKGVKTEAELNKMRDRVKGNRVYWVLPAIKPDIQEIVKKVAKERGDVVLPITHLQPDGVHPSWAGYKVIAEQAK